MFGTFTMTFTFQQSIKIVLISIATMVRERDTLVQLGIIVKSVNKNRNQSFESPRKMFFTISMK